MSTGLKPTSSPSSPTSPTPPGPAPDQALKTGFRWFLVGFSLLGLCVGYFAGNSNSPVIGVVLPLLFGLVGSAGGFYLWAADLSAPATTLRLRFLGVALTGFILLLLAGSVYGVLLRTGLGIASFFPRSLFVAPPSGDLPALGERNAREAIQLVLMRGRLRALGASDAEQQIILHQIVADQAAFDTLRNTPGTLNRLAALIDRAFGSLEDRAVDKRPREVEELALYLDSYSKNLKRFAGQAEAGEKMSPALVSYVVGTVKSNLEQRMDSFGVMSYLSEHEPFRQRLVDLRWALFEETERLNQNPSLGRPQVIQEVDQFLNLFAGGAKGTESSLVSKPNIGPAMAH